MDTPILLDTCAAIWVLEDAISKAAVESLNSAERSGLPVYISPITAWELGLLVARGRLTSTMTPQRLFERVLDVPHVRLAEMPPEVLILSSFLPGSPPRDPADRILAATAREFGYVLMTRDRALLEYAEQGHMQALTC
jgi:PIN domain nuclease of toxin-antitoxin system